MKNLQIDIAENGEISVAFSAPNARAAHVFVEALTAALNGLREIKPRPVVLPAVDAADPRIGKRLDEHWTVKKGDVWRSLNGLLCLADEDASSEDECYEVDVLLDDEDLPPGESVSPEEVLVAVGVSEEEFRRGVEEGRWKK